MKMSSKSIVSLAMAAVMLMPYGVNAAVKMPEKAEDGRVILGSNSVGESYSQTSEKKELTIEEAVNNAISYSRDIKDLDDTIEVTEDNRQTVTENYDMVGKEDAYGNLLVPADYETVHNLSVSIRQIAMALSTYSANKEIAKEKIDYNVRNLFYGIDKAEKSLVLYDKQIALQERQLKVYEVMNNLGKLSTVEYNEYKRTYDDLVSDKSAIETQISSAYRSLNQLMGKPLNQEYDLVVDELEFKDMEEVNLDNEIDKALSSNQTVKSAQDAVDLNKYSLDTYVNYSDRVSTRSTIETTYEKSTRTLADAKTALRNSMTTIYDQIRESERTYKENEAQLASLESQLGVKDVQLKLGKITQLEYDAFVLSIDNIKNTMRLAAFDHDLLVRQFENSNLIM